MTKAQNAGAKSAGPLQRVQVPFRDAQEPGEFRLGKRQGFGFRRMRVISHARIL
jgi:hypothetical protein